MKQYIKAIIPFVALLLTAVVTSSCEKEDEVPPREERSMIYKTFKMPEPTELTADEKSVVDAITDEYRKATDQ